MQREKIMIQGDLCLPTAGMKVHRWDNMTNFYLDEGQLHWPHGDCDTVPALYIEAGGDAMVVCAEKLGEGDCDQPLCQYTGLRQGKAVALEGARRHDY